MRAARDTVVIVGSGFSGTILARALNARGRSVVLVERGVHPRFALGESSTPLASICLERLAQEYELPDLLALAAYARWNRELPGVGHGLKRGFTFYAQRPGRAFVNGPGNEARLLVAASPDDEIADSHWFRSDVDHHLVRRATDEGVELIDDCEVERVERRGDRWRLYASRAGRPLRIDARFVVDASGGAGLIPGLGPAEQPHGGRAADGRTPDGRPPADDSPHTGLIFGHFANVGSFVEAASPASFARAPYPEERAAVHHLLDEGWMYVLPFDDGLVSAGFVIDRGHPDGLRLLTASPAEAWRAILDRYPTIARQFEASEPVRPMGSVGRLQRRASAAAGDGWAALPHAFAFTSPMFSTGIAWSLVGVERLAAALTGDDALLPWHLAVYGTLLQAEADHLRALVAPAYRLRQDFDAFSAWSYVYFTAASYQEAWQRLCDPPQEGWTGVGFLGACDPLMRKARDESLRDLEGGPQDAGRTHGGHAPRAAGPVGSGRRAALERWVGRRVAHRNLAGLADPARERLYPVDLEPLLRRAALLGLSGPDLRSRLPRLRGPA